MIKYKLVCKNCDLKFDSWFASSNEYERLKKKKILNCHNCNSYKVEKTIMAPQLINSKSKIDKKIDLALTKKNVSINKKSVDKSFLSSLSRVATELVAGLIIGTGLGLLIDNWLETKPLFLIIFFFLGAFAGIYNLWRQLSGNGLKIGYFDKGKKN